MQGLAQQSLSGRVPSQEPQEVVECRGRGRDSYQNQLVGEDELCPVVGEDVPANQGIEGGGGEERPGRRSIIIW